MVNILLSSHPKAARGFPRTPFSARQPVLA
jgi:hypothetical protein